MLLNIFIFFNNFVFQCKTKAFDEKFNFNLEDCFKNYRKAHLLFHTLSHQVSSEKDKKTLNHYRQLVQQRIFILKEKGLAIKPIYSSEIP